MSRYNESFEEALKIAGRELYLPYYDSRPENIYALIQHGNDPVLRAEITSFIKNGFDILRKVAYNKKIEEDKAWNDGYESSAMVNHVVFGALARAAGLLGEKELAPTLYKEFLGIKKAFYELSIERGTLSIALSMLEYEGEIREIQQLLDSAVANEYNIIESQDILEMFYAFCILKKDKAKALNYLSNYKRLKNLSFVAAALADLDVKEAIPTLKDRFVQLDNPFAKEAFLEAIHRLESQKEVPASKDRMIWMFGKRTSSELALGNNTDNEFVLRAIKKSGDLELEGLYESIY